MLREMKWKTVISFCPFYLFGILGMVVLIIYSDDLFQYLGIKPIVEEINTSEVIVMSIICILSMLLSLGILIFSMLGFGQRNLKKFIAQLDESEKEKLINDYQNAKAFGNKIKIGRLYTFAVHQTSNIFVNKEIIWVYDWYKREKYGSTYYLSIYTINSLEPNNVVVDEKRYMDIINYYSNYFPHIAVGYKDEFVYYYNNDKEQFLNLKYYKQ